MRKAAIVTSFYVLLVVLAVFGIKATAQAAPAQPTTTHSQQATATPAATSAIMPCGFNSPNAAKLWADPSMDYTRHQLDASLTKATYMGSAFGPTKDSDSPTCAALSSVTSPWLSIQDDDGRWDFYSLQELGHSTPAK